MACDWYSELIYFSNYIMYDIKNESRCSSEHLSELAQLCQQQERRKGNLDSFNLLAPLLIDKD